MKFKIPMIGMPTLEEHRAASSAWLSRIRPCLYEHWPEDLRRMSFATRMIALSSDDQTALCEAFDGKGPQLSGALANKIDANIAEYFPDCGVFAKLSSRSAKDAWCETFKCLSAADILSQFASSGRILEDLIEYKYLDDLCYLLLREWHDIPKHEEWRCFVSNGCIIGITQYHYTDDFGALYGDGAAIYSRIMAFLERKVIPVMHADPLVVDVWLRDEPMVIEINPYGASDPCLLDYADLEKGGCGMLIGTKQTRKVVVA